MTEPELSVLAVIARSEYPEYVDRMWREAIAWAAAGQLPKVYVQKIVELVEADCADQLRGAVQALERIQRLADLHPGDWPTVGRRAVSQAQQALDRLGGQ